jgi:hypothetical protein
MATISTLLPFVQNRVEEFNPAIFWSDELELQSGLMEAQCDLMLLVGRPDLLVNVPLTIQPNTVWQSVPKGLFCLTNLQGPASEVWKITLEDMDYAMVSDSGWEQDIGDQILRWGPLGFNRFFVWPAVAQEQVVLATGIASPIQGTWPYDGSQPVVFHDEQFQALEKYAAGYARLKEGSAEFSEGVKLYQDYLQDAKRLTALEDRRDRFIFDGSTGATTVANPTTLR